MKLAESKSTSICIEVEMINCRWRDGQEVLISVLCRDATWLWFSISHSLSFGVWFIPWSRWDQWYDISGWTPLLCHLHFIRVFIQVNLSRRLLAIASTLATVNSHLLEQDQPHRSLILHIKVGTLTLPANSLITTGCLGQPELSCETF